MTNRCRCAGTRAPGAVAVLAAATVAAVGLLIIPGQSAAAGVEAAGATTGVVSSAAIASVSAAESTTGQIDPVGLSRPAATTSGSPTTPSSPTTAVTRSPTSSSPTSSTTSPPAGSSTTASAATTAVPTTSSSAPVTTPQQEITSTIVGAPTSTVAARSIQAASVVAGGHQEVVFAGFARNESVSVMLYSPPVSLPPAQADSGGTVTIDFTVPAGLSPGTYLLRAVGRASNVTGVATFVVTAAPVSGSTASTGSTAPVTAVIPPVVVPNTFIPPAVIPSGVPAPDSLSTPATSGAAASTPPVSTPRLVWPWYVLGVVVLLWVAFGVFVVRRRLRHQPRRRQSADHGPREAFAAGAAAAGQAGRLPPDRSNAVVVDEGDHPVEQALLSGRDHPDNPSLLSGQNYRPDVIGALPTTSRLRGPSGPEADDEGRDPGGPPAADASGLPAAGASGPRTPGAGAVGTETTGPPTGAWSPDFLSGEPPTTRNSGDPDSDPRADR